MDDTTNRDAEREKVLALQDPAPGLRAEIVRLREENAALRTAVERVRALHQTNFLVHALDGEPFAACDYCGRIDNYDPHEGTGDRCPTLRALGGDA